MKIELHWDGMIVPVADFSWASITEAAERLHMTSSPEFFYEDEEGDKIKLVNEFGAQQAENWALDQGLDVLRLFLDVPFEDDGSWDKMDFPLSPKQETSEQQPSPPLSVGPLTLDPDLSAPQQQVQWVSDSEDDEPSSSVEQDDYAKEKEEEHVPSVEQDDLVEEEDEDELVPVSIVEQDDHAEEEEEHVSSAEQVNGAEEEHVSSVEQVNGAEEEPVIAQPEVVVVHKKDVVEEEKMPALLMSYTSPSQLPDQWSSIQFLKPTMPLPSLPPRSTDLWSHFAFEKEEESAMTAKVDSLVAKILAGGEESDDLQEEETSLTHELLKMCANKRVLDLVCDALKNTLLRQAICDASNAELAAEGAGARVAKIRVLSHFTKLCAMLVDLHPEFEHILLKLVSPPRPSPATTVEQPALPPPQPLIEQSRVFCDGCEADELVAAEAEALGFRKQISRYICGPRFKSAVHADFDLCTLCEESQRFQKSHGPFLKITTPEECPDVILCIPKMAPGMTLASHLDLSQQPALAKEFSDFVDFRRNRRTGGNPPPPPPPQPTAAAPMAIPRPTMRPNVDVAAAAPKKSCAHALQAFETQHLGYHCDGCGSRAQLNSTLHGCRVCNFDLCDACLAQFPSSKVTIAPMPKPAPASHAQEEEQPLLAAAQPPSARPAPPSIPQAKFVCDVTLADGSVVRPGERLNKTWRIRNTGEQAWGPGIKLMHVGGDAMGGPRLGVDIPSNVKPGECINVSVDLTMPMLPGRYTSYWRLITQHPANAKFGHRFWVTVNVVPAVVPPVVAAAPPSAPTVEDIFAEDYGQAPPMTTTATAFAMMQDDDFSMSVARIVDFGFTDLDKIVTTLREENGDFGRTIDRLLAGDQ